MTAPAGTGPYNACRNGGRRRRSRRGRWTTKEPALTTDVEEIPGTGGPDDEPAGDGLTGDGQAADDDDLADDESAEVAEEQAAAPRPADRWPLDAVEPQRGLVAALRARPDGLGTWWSLALRVVVVLQVALVVTAATVVALHFPVFAPIDEEAHYSYVQEIAQHGTLPVLGNAPTSPQGLAIAEGTYPKPATHTYTLHELSGLAYEAFQPPLYYALAVPAFDATPNYRDKVYALRLFDVGLLVAALLLAGRLARVTLGRRWLVGWSALLLYFSLPGVVVRAVTVSNLALAVPLAIAFATELWLAWTRHSGRRLVLAGVMLGLCVLTQFELVVLVPVFVLVALAEGVRRWRARPRTRAGGLRPPSVLTPVAVALAFPLVMAAPWLAFNEANYHMLSGGPIAITEQTPAVNPHHLHISLGQLPSETIHNVADPVLPSEWTTAFDRKPRLGQLDDVLTGLLVPLSLALVVLLGRRLFSVRAAILGLPWVSNVVELGYIRYGEQWPVTVRYTFATLPLLVVLAAGSALSVLRARRVAVLVLGAATAAVAVVWADLVWHYTGPYPLT